jgi:hypothetical protein
MAIRLSSLPCGGTGRALSLKLIEASAVMVQLLFCGGAAMEELQIFIRYVYIILYNMSYILLFK